MQGTTTAGEAAWRLWCASRQRAHPPLLLALLRQLDEQGLLSIDAGQAALLDLLQPAAPLLPPDAEHRRWVPSARAPSTRFWHKRRLPSLHP